MSRLSENSSDVSVTTVPVLIIGAGAAGARVAIELEQNEVTPLVISDRDHGDAHTTWARGGINASLGSLDEEDNWKIHSADTIDEGHYINDPNAVKQVTKNMPDRIEELDEWGMDLNKTEDGKIDQRYFGAQSFRRTCFAGDHTGESMLDTLVEKAQSLSIPYRDNTRVVSLLETESGGVGGAVAYDMETLEPSVFLAEYVVLATGGYAGVYDRNSSRDTENTGESVHLAVDIGAKGMDIEFVQFHPTGMVGSRYGSEWDGRLVTEAVRGEGGRLYNSKDERFMEKYSPKQMELDARDVVARAIRKEINQGRGTDNGGVYLDISHKPKEFIKERLPRMYARFEKLGVDISKEPMEVAPTAHYSMGGIDFNPITGSVEQVPNLFVAGEATAGVHGANRLGGNSLAETVAIGKETGEHIATQNPDRRSVTDHLKKEYKEIVSTYSSTPVENSPQVDPSEISTQIRTILQEYAGINKEESDLKEGLNKLSGLKDTFESQCKIDKSAELDSFAEYSRVESMFTVSEMIFQGSLQRAESRGSHYRVNHPSKDESYRHNILYTKTTDSVQTETRDIPKISDEVQQTLDENYELDYHHLE